MTTPLLQVALDHTDLDQALDTAQTLKNQVDVLEAGTILCASAGITAIKKLREVSSSHILLADYKVADAGKTFAELVFSHGANWMTVICAAPLATMEVALAHARAHNGDIQIELYGNWNFDDAKDWIRIGIAQVVYHRGRDAQAAGQTWSDADIQKISKLCELGLEVSVTGGLVPEDIKIFQGYPVKAFISGRGLYAAPNPIVECEKFKEEILKYW